MFDPLDMPGDYETEYSTPNSENPIEPPIHPKKHLSEEEIALRIVEMFVSNSKASSVEAVVEHYFFVLDKLKNKGETTTSYSESSYDSTESSYDSYSPQLSKEPDEKDMISEKEFVSDSEADEINKMFD